VRRRPNAWTAEQEAAALADPETFDAVAQAAGFRYIEPSPDDTPQTTHTTIPASTFQDGSSEQSAGTK